MEYLSALWMPILVSAVAVFVVSSVIHMMTPMHKSDCRRLPDEGRLLEALRAQSITPGEYMFPGADSMKDMGTPEMQEKYRRGPVGMLTICPSGPPNMGKSLSLWFLFSLLASVFTAWVCGHSLRWGAEFGAVFPVAAIAAVVTYSIGNLPDGIWKGTPWSTVAKYIVDGVLYGLATGAVFAWLWPAAV